MRPPNLLMLSCRWRAPGVDRRSPWRRAEPHSDQRSAQGRLAVLAVHAAGAELTLVPAAAAEGRCVRSMDRADPLPYIAGHVVGADRAARRRMRADLVGTERERL